MSRLSFNQLFVILFVLFAILIGASYLFAWTGPTATAPNGNVSAPINVGSSSQVKSGGLWVASLGTDGGAQFNGNIGIKTAAQSSWGVYATGNTGGVYAQATNGQAIRGYTTAGGYAGYFVGGGSSAGGVYAQNSSGYYAFLGYPGSSWSVYSNGPTYTSSYSRADGGFCIGGSCKSNWGQGAFGGMYLTYTSNGACGYANYLSSGCTCPSYAPYVGTIGAPTESYIWSIYYCYGQ